MSAAWAPFGFLPKALAGGLSERPATILDLAGAERDHQEEGPAEPIENHSNAR